jgi:hypothetical protein
MNFQKRLFHNHYSLFFSYRQSDPCTLAEALLLRETLQKPGEEKFVAAADLLNFKPSKNRMFKLI